MTGYYLIVIICRSRMSSQMEKELRELEVKRQRRLKEKQIQKAIMEKALTNDNTQELEKYRQQKLRDHRLVFVLLFYLHKSQCI